jgi:hypothetical protein
MGGLLVVLGGRVHMLLQLACCSGGSMGEGLHGSSARGSRPRWWRRGGRATVVAAQGKRCCVGSVERGPR